MSIEKQPAKWVENLLRFGIRTYIESRSKIVIDRNDTIDLKPPYIILANHVNNWDPLFINAYVPETISFIAGDSLFRNTFLKKLLDYVGAIPKAKFRNDTSTIRSIIKAKKHDRVIGIFPEGNRNWDGKTEPLMTATAKLIKLLDIPVVIATIRGGYLSHPRWANKHRRGTISISYQKLWDQGDLKNKSTETIHYQLTEALGHNEMEWQATEKNLYQGKSLANYLERLLFICPHCEKIGHLYSEANRFRCRACQYEIEYTEIGEFEQVNYNLIHQTPLDWNQWQLNFLNSILLRRDSKEKLMIDDHVKLYVTDEHKPFKLVSSGNITWQNPANQVIFQADNGEDYQFKIEAMNGLNIHLHHQLDFTYENKFYRVEFYQPRTSAYKLLKVLQILSNAIRKEEVVS
ncbi:MAG TPA: hypothetical protein GXZ58_00085 [Bacilli bacterium]|nr:hypothetical protein [Bacteroidales bacterium]HHU18656.1 hypothetical protein [Bacilli bacterium]